MSTGRRPARAVRLKPGRRFVGSRTRRPDDAGGASPSKPGSPPPASSRFPDHLLASIGPPDPARGRGLGGDIRGPDGYANSETIALSATLCCDLERFSLHAKVRIEASDREGLERLCRYIARPPIKVERLSLAPDGRVIYALRRHWRDGTSAIAFEPLDFLSRLAAGSPSRRSSGSSRCATRTGAYLPRPRAHLLTYHGILAPAAEWRDLVVPRPRVKSSPSPEPASSSPSPAPGPESGTPETALTAQAQRPTRTTWAELMKRAFALDVLVCPHCGGPRKLIAGSPSQRRRSVVALRRCATNRGLPHRGVGGAQDPRALGPLDRVSSARASPRAARARARLVAREVRSRPKLAPSGARVGEAFAPTLWRTAERPPRVLVDPSQGWHPLPPGQVGDPSTPIRVAVLERRG